MRIIQYFLACMTFMVLFTHPLDSQSIDFDNFKQIKPRNIGPAGMSGRVTAIDVDLSDKDKIYAGTASGGLWLSTNGGITWKPIFDDIPVAMMEV